MVEGDSGDVRRMLVPIDFSSTAEAALVYALRLAVPLRAEILLCHAGALPDYELPDLVSPGIRAAAAALVDMAGALFAAARQELAACAQRAQQRSPGVPITTTFIEGLPADGIVQCAREWGADLIVMGSRNRRGVVHLLLGSVAEQVVRRSPCPVLIVHPHPQPPAGG